MISIYPEQINIYLKKKLWQCYLIFGSDYFLLKNSAEHICQIAKKYGFYEYYRYQIESNTNWNEIYHSINSKSIFNYKQIFILTLSETLNITYISKNLIQLINLLHNDLLLLLIGNNFNIKEKNSIWFNSIKNTGIFINCITPKNERLINWINQQSQKLSISLTNNIINFFCYFYNNNLFDIYQILLQTSLIHKNKKISLTDIKDTINELAKFKYYHFINTLLLGKTKYCYYILQKLKYEGCSLSLLIFLIYRELKKTMMIKIENYTNTNNKKILRNIYKKHHVTSTNALNKLSIQQIQTAIQIISKIDLYLKEKNYIQNVWQKLEILIIFICGINLPQNIIDEL